ncbi:lytic polysaccharide monooxygenase auxiliary activity family 9 protein [Micromonospora sp. NBC_01813]|uniref:lytic polysaccharide monooxygenase auxiliary activity family 9 protein n=1 Tax=Micromonospora sp. NBC_01813 TaxID=2975988 RepID=UPI002DDABE04|nr:lytic polysaccharide monooxygenase [Micromonospora sp. NBC_01813]WSA09907.1 lytic polysaccharide monooxygenase [Micromonospora sp. NBC_01813]
MKTLRRVAVIAAASALAAGLLTVVTPNAASAHGAAMMPGSRTYLCWVDGLDQTGQIIPTNQACSAAVNQSGANSLYNWFSVLRSDGAGRTSGFIPDGQLCSGGSSGFSGYNLARNDWPLTHLTAGASMEFKYSNWAHHPGTFYFWVTKDSWSPNRPLAWSDLEATPFLTVTNPPQRGSVGSNDGHYYFSGRLPSNKTGQHIIYSHWVRSDSQENFYGCSDVVFDGGNGQVTGIRGNPANPNPTPTPAPTTPGPNPTTPGPNPTTPGPNPTTPAPSGGCSATYRTVSSWSGGFQGEVTVRNTSTASIGGWSTNWNLGSGVTINSVWSGTHTTSGSSITVRNVAWNGNLGPNASTTFGFTANGSSGTPSVSCSAS